MARRCGAKLVYEVHDLWPLSPVELGNMSPRHPFIRVMQWAENFACRSADRVVSMLPNAMGHLEAHGMAAAKFVHVPNGVALDESAGADAALPESHAAVLGRLRESGQFILGYAGGHAVSNALGFLLPAARLLTDQRVSFVLVGAGAEKASLEHQARTLDLRNVTFLPAVSKSAVPALLREMDALYIGWQNKPIYRFGVSPNKIFDYMLAGKPVVHSINASNDLVAESGCGITVPPENPEAIAEAIRQLASLSQDQREEMGRRGRNFALKHHDYRVLAKNFLAALS
jgi:glycosyltransferase involved in cell wall biosynthesis